MISRQCQRYLLALFNEFIHSEEKIEEFQAILWKNIQAPSGYITLFMASIKPKTFEDAWVMTQTDLRTLLDEMNIQHTFDELPILARHLSRSKRTEVTFKDWLYFVFHKSSYNSMDDFDKLARYLSESYEVHLKDLQKDRDLLVKKQENSVSFNEEKSEVYFDSNMVSNKPWKIPCWNSLSHEVAVAYRLVFNQELANIRNTKLASEMVSYDACYDRKLIFKLLDSDAKGYFTCKELKQFTYRMGQPTYDKSLRYFYQRMRQEFAAQVPAIEFMFFFFDMYEEGSTFLNQAYNFYYKKKKHAFKPKIKNNLSRLPSNSSLL